MKRNIWFLAVAASAVLAGCSKDDDGDLSPSMLDKDWYRIEDSADPTDHVRYEIYSEYGLPVFYNDTIGSDFRGYSMDGSPVTHYEVIDFGYWITYVDGAPKMTYKLNEAYLLRNDKSEVKAGVEFVRDYVLPSLPERLYPMSLLLVDDMVRNYASDARGCHEFRTFQGLTCMAVGRVGQSAGMSEAEKKYHAGYVMATLFAEDIVDNHDYQVEFEAFFDAAEKKSDGTSYCNTQLVGRNSNTSRPAYILQKPDEPGKRLHWLSYGFLNFSIENMVYLAYENGVINKDLSQVDTKCIGYYTPSYEQDLRDYIAEVLVGDDAAFEQKYAEYPKVLERYRIMKQLFAEYRAGFGEE